jgi:hypothetical protein
VQPSLLQTVPLYSLIVSPDPTFVLLYFLLQVVPLMLQLLVLFHNLDIRPVVVTHVLEDDLICLVLYVTVMQLFTDLVYFRAQQLPSVLFLTHHH